MRITSFCLALGGALSLLVATSHAAVISVNFNGGNGNTINQDGPAVAGSAGAVSAANWNNEAPASGTGLTLVDSANVNAATLTYLSPNLYGANPSGGGTSGGAGDNALMTGYLDNFSGVGQSLTVSGLGTAFTSGGYRVLVYQNGDSNGSFGYSATDNAAHTSFAYGLQTGNNGGNYPLVGGTNGYVGSTSTDSNGPTSPANYVILNGLNGSSFTLTGLAGTTGDPRARINGFQIQSVPEPGSLVLLGLGAVGLLAVARRRRNG